uniref:Uncharacterized protein n=1 Tax=Hemiselmis tepida TaxID=464990 RepID=A0A7S0Z250_9CRYP|mmetsp:Transcript_30560/g.77384  ORF Transcript_30560/g.77384 Transcript_30560/m.77384 type:complete len:138 (+) Transcript_30560:171-584(+)
MVTKSDGGIRDGATRLLAHLELHRQPEYTIDVRVLWEKEKRDKANVNERYRLKNALSAAGVQQPASSWLPRCVGGVDIEQEIEILRSMMVERNLDPGPPLVYAKANFDKPTPFTQTGNMMVNNVYQGGGRPWYARKD